MKTIIINKDYEGGIVLDKFINENIFNKYAIYQYNAWSNNGFSTIDKLRCLYTMIFCWETIKDKIEFKEFDKYIEVRIGE